jgi:hypothetical protein
MIRKSCEKIVYVKNEMKQLKKKKSSLFYTNLKAFIFFFFSLSIHMNNQSNEKKIVEKKNKINILTMMVESMNDYY